PLTDRSMPRSWRSGSTTYFLVFPRVSGIASSDCCTPWPGAYTERRKKMFSRLWRSKFLTTHARSIGDLVEALSRAADELRRMQRGGVTLDPDGGVADGYAELLTDDPAAAREFGFAGEE